MTRKELLLAAARCWAKAGQWEKAAERYREAGAFRQAAEAYLKLGRWVAAEGCFAEAESFMEAARLCSQNGWAERAKKRYKEALEGSLSAPEQVEALVVLHRLSSAVDGRGALCARLVHRGHGPGRLVGPSVGGGFGADAGG